MQPDIKSLLEGARNFVKIAAAQQPAAKDMGLDMDSASGLASDYLLGGTVGLNRAGRAKQLGRAMHKDIPGPLNHPQTSLFLQALGGGLGGGAIGGLAGYGLGSLDSPQSASTGAGMGTAIGAGVGGLGGMFRSLYKRRQAMREIAKAYETGTPLDPAVKPHTGVINSLLTPLAGPTRSGEADVYEAIHGKYHGHQDRVTPDIARTGLNAATEVGTRVAPLAATPFTALTGLLQNLNARRRVNKVDAENRKKTASSDILQQLLDGGRSLVKVAETTPRNFPTAGYAYGAPDSLTDNPMPSLPVWLSNILTPLRTDASALVNKVKGLSPGSNPLHAGMLGAGIGALGGLAGSALSGDDEEDNSPLRAALLGGLAGGGLGAGAGALNAKYNPAAQSGPPKTPKPVPPAIVSPEQLGNRKKLNDLIGALRPTAPDTAPAISPQLTADAIPNMARGNTRDITAIPATAATASPPPAAAVPEASLQPRGVGLPRLPQAQAPLGAKAPAESQPLPETALQARPPAMRNGGEGLPKPTVNRPAAMFDRWVPPSPQSRDRTQPQLPAERSFVGLRARTPAPAPTPAATSAASPPVGMNAIRKKQQETQDAINRSLEYSRQPAPVLATPN